MSFRGLLVLLFTLLFAAPALARPAAPSPSLWHIKGEIGEVYLLGSVHVLPPNMQWRSPPIGQALSRSDVYVFEVPQDETALAQLSSLMQAKGFLPPNESLRDKLHPEVQPDYDAAVAASGLPPATLEHERPWLAALQMMFAQITKLKFAAGNGVDSVLMAEAAKQHKQMRYLETIAEQFAILAPDDPVLEMEEFESGLKDLSDVAGGIEPMVKAWSKGDQPALDRLINGDLDSFPQARKLLLDDRNKHWVPQIEAMLKEKQVFFITVGAGHLTGPGGLPGLLRRGGYRVDGP